MEPVTHDEAIQIVKYCYCSDCWEHLTIYSAIADGTMVKNEAGRAMYDVRCNTDGCQHHGYVSKRTVDRRLAESQVQRIEALYALQDAVPWLKPAKKRTNILKSLRELGFE